MSSGNLQGNSSLTRELGIACMLNTEVGSILAVIRRTPDPTSQFSPAEDEAYNSALVRSLKCLRSFIFKPQQEWYSIDPSIYLSPFLDVIQSYDVPVAATGVALSTILKILNLGVFNEKTPGAQDAVNSVVLGLTNFRVEKMDSGVEDVVMMRMLQVLMAIMRHPAAVLLTDHAVCSIIHNCFVLVQRSANRGDLLQRNAKHAMHELIQVIFAGVPGIAARKEGQDLDVFGASGYGIHCIIDIFQFLCSMLSVVDVGDAEGATADEDVQLFALTLINSAIEMSGEGIGKHPKLLRLIQDDLFFHLIHYGACFSPLLLSMICSIVLNLYHVLRRFLRIQLEAFFTFVLFRVAAHGRSSHLQEVALEGIINFYRQPNFVIEAFVNYDCDPLRKNILEDTGKLLCKKAYPVSSPLSSVQVQAFEGLVNIIQCIADSIQYDGQLDLAESTTELHVYRPFWIERCENFEDMETWVEFIKTRKLQKKKIMIATVHFNMDEKKGLEYLKIFHLIPHPPDSKSIAYFYRYAPGLDKNKIGDYLGDPDEFNIQVLKAYTDMFRFSGVSLDTALRTYLETFRLPGESQKIVRILEAFSERFYQQQSSDMFASKDVVFVLCYSVIMLNTDQHNPQVKKKMTEEEFIRNNRAINGGSDLPREYLSELFQSISKNAITLFGQSNSVIEMNPSRWADLIRSSNGIEPFLLCDFHPCLYREMYATISGPSVATLSAILEHADEEDLLQECIEGLVFVAQIAQHKMEDVLDELLTCLCKLTLLLNPYATSEEILFGFGNDVRPRLAIVSVFTIANKFGSSIRGGWRNVVDCLVRLKRLKLLPQMEFEQNASCTSLNESPAYFQADSGVIFPYSLPGSAGGNHISSMMCQFSRFMSLHALEESLPNAESDFEQNMKIIQQCNVGSIFVESSNLSHESLQYLGRALIFAAAGKGQKYNTPIEEEEIVGFCWDLLVTLTCANAQRFPLFWPYFHDSLLVVSQFPLFSSSPFPEKAIIGLFKICLKVISLTHASNSYEDLIFRSINLVWKLDKEVFDTCFICIAATICKILKECPHNIHSILGWKIILSALSITGRHPEAFDEGVDSLILFMSDKNNLNKTNYISCIDCAFGFAVLKISPLEKSIKLLDLMADSTNLLVQWYQEYSDSGSSTCSISNVSTSSTEDLLRENSTNFPQAMFIRVAETFRKASLGRREEFRNYSVLSLRRIFNLGDGLGFTPAACLWCFNNIVFAMVDDLHEKMSEYLRRPISEKGMTGMEGTLMLSMELLAEVFLNFLKLLSQTPEFRQFWLGVLRRMDTCMKTDFGDSSQMKFQVLIPDLLRKMITAMKEKDILVQRDGNELWEITAIQIQWIAPSIKDELFSI